MICCSTVPTMQGSKTARVFFQYARASRFQCARCRENRADSKLGPFEYSFTRKDGHFEGAIFEGADLRKINLENAHLQGASLLQAKLQGAQFYNANLNGANAQPGEASRRLARQRST